MTKAEAIAALLEHVPGATRHGATVVEFDDHVSDESIAGGRVRLVVMIAGKHDAAALATAIDYAAEMQRLITRWGRLADGLAPRDRIWLRRCIADLDAVASGRTPAEVPTFTPAKLPATPAARRAPPARGRKVRRRG